MRKSQSFPSTTSCTPTYQLLNTKQRQTGKLLEGVREKNGFFQLSTHHKPNFHDDFVYFLIQKAGKMSGPTIDCRLNLVLVYLLIYSLMSPTHLQKLRGKYLKYYLYDLFKFHKQVFFFCSSQFFFLLKIYMYLFWNPLTRAACEAPIDLPCLYCTRCV